MTDISFDATWNKPTSITHYLDGRPIVNRMDYDPANGNLTRLTDVLGNETRMTYNAPGAKSPRF